MQCVYTMLYACKLTINNTAVPFISQTTDSKGTLNLEGHSTEISTKKTNSLILGYLMLLNIRGKRLRFEGLEHA